MKYKNFTLDQFQIDSIESIEKNNSVVVSAATGTGKTLIADYIINKYIKENKRIIYTAPIKALSNQKYKEFKEEYGAENVGILTGDVTINHNAQIVIMTTEIYRNMLVTNDESLATLSYVIFDEIHFINDIERGTVWEESIIFSPKHVRFLCLSATIPNAKQFASWIESIKGHKVDVVKFDKRAVPLTHYVFDYMLGMTNIKAVKKDVEKENSIDYYKVNKKKNDRNKFNRNKIPVPTHIDVLNHLIEQKQLPAFFFVFSRKKCEELAEELAMKNDFTTPEQKKEIIEYFSTVITDDIRAMDSVLFMKRILVKGIAVHHAGFLPKIKEIVEELFGRGLIQVLYTTETFAVGINMPAKSVCFNSLEKFDGFNFRYLNSKEYFQLAGRAGRRGIDTEGRAIAIIDRNHANFDKIEEFTSKDTDPIISQFKLSFNTALNLVNNHTPGEREIILKSNFDYYLRKQSNKQVRIMTSYKHKYSTLEKMGYIKNDELTQKGIFTTHIYSNELLVAELFTTDLYKELTDTQILILLASISYEERRMDKFKFGDKKNYYAIIDVIEENKYVSKTLNKMSIARMNKLVTEWAEGCEFSKLMDYANYDEGDIIRLFRQVIDLGKQIMRGAESNRQLEERISECLKKIHRDVVKVDF